MGVLLASIYSDAQWPWERKGILLSLVEFQRGTFPAKKSKQGRNPLGNWV